MICDRAEQVDIRKLAKLGHQLPDVFELEGVSFSTTWTSTNFGGRRQWFLCPVCDRRCAIIYKPSETQGFGCRICLKGRYASEHMSPQDRRLHAAFKVRKRLGQRQGGIGVPFPPKPEGMHWRTYEGIRNAATREELSIVLQDYADLHGINLEVARSRFLKA